VTSFRNYKAQKSMVKSIIGAGGTNNVVKGQINLPFNIDGKVIYQYFQIVPELRNSLIVGMDFLKANQGSDMPTSVHHRGERDSLLCSLILSTYPRKVTLPSTVLTYFVSRDSGRKIRRYGR
jgi:hypothetical protein